MPVPNLAQLAGRKVPIRDLFFAAEHQGNVVNQEFIGQIWIHRDLRRVNLRTMCRVCNQDGDCLCYLFMIRHYMIECYWGEAEDYQKLEDWLVLPN